MKVTEGINKFVNDVTLFKNSTFLNSTWGTAFRGVRLRDLRELFVGLNPFKISYDRTVWTAAIYRPVKTFFQRQLSKIGICQDPGGKEELFSKAEDPTPEQAAGLVEPTAFARYFSRTTRKDIKKAMFSLKNEIKNDSLEFLADGRRSTAIPKKIFEKLPEAVKKHMKDGIFHDPATGNVVALVWDENNKTLHVSFPGTSTFSDDKGAGKYGFFEQRTTDLTTFAGRHIPSSHKQAADIIGACKEAIASYQKENKPDFKIGLNCYGYCHGGGLALYAGSKNRVKTYTLVGLPLNWRMQADIGEANMNYMVREDLVTNISVEGDNWSDPDTGPFSGVSKTARFLEGVGVFYPRPRKFGKTYRIKWKHDQNAFINHSFEADVNKKVETLNKTRLGRLQLFKKNNYNGRYDETIEILEKEKTRDDAVAEYGIRPDQEKEEMRKKFSKSYNIHTHPHLFVNWKANR